MCIAMRHKLTIRLWGGCSRQTVLWAAHRQQQQELKWKKYLECIFVLAFAQEVAPDAEILAQSAAHMMAREELALKLEVRAQSTSLHNQPVWPAVGGLLHLRFPGATIERHSRVLTVWMLPRIEQ